MTPRGPRIVVIGAGIVGAAIAYHLARRGAAVTLLDRGDAAGGATGGSFAWINASHGAPGPYRRLRRRALQEYRRLDRELAGRLQPDWCGALVWWREPGATERFVRAQAADGHDVALIGRDRLATLEPNLIEPPACAAWAPSEGALDPVAATRTLAAAAREAGAELRLQSMATTLAATGGRVTGVRTSEGPLGADVVVLAAGTASGALCAPLGVALPMNNTPALLLRFDAPARLVTRIVSGPDLEIRQADNGQLLVAEDHHPAPEIVAQQTHATIRRQLRGGSAVALEHVSATLRPIPADGLPVIGFSRRIGGLYLAVMHVGVTLAPAVGRFAATEILDGTPVAALETCRPDRFVAAEA